MRAADGAGALERLRAVECSKIGRCSLNRNDALHELPHGPQRRLLWARKAEDLGVDSPEELNRVVGATGLRVELGLPLHHRDHRSARQRLALLGGIERGLGGIELTELLVVGAVHGREQHAFVESFRKHDVKGLCHRDHGLDGAGRGRLRHRPVDERARAGCRADGCTVAAATDRRDGEPAETAEQQQQHD